MYHMSVLYDRVDRGHSELINNVLPIGSIDDHEICLFANFNGSMGLGSVHGV
jgi:hypothetical protein